MTPELSPAALPPSGWFAVVDGTEYRARFGTDHEHGYLLQMDRADWEVFRSAAEIRRSPAEARNLWVKVAPDAVERYFSRRLAATWFGEPVRFEVIDPDTVRVHYDRDPRLAQLMGMQGSQHEGFTADVPFTELADVRVIESDEPVRS
ncbi:hypothetical protein [Actinotalea sp. Marseille-Q4924]|uniref:hypothetical protein n=1 Tax=Actinotalea sp. Marseille-Q4924 TaxID=2866571 RepID=UPI001CE3F62C|nr:hypothetical protein [Actinotalea sp. Marseille-Q4924]